MLLLWALFGPLSPAFQQSLGLGDVATRWLVAIPVVLGSVMRVPMGVLTDRYGARRVFPLLMAFTILPLVGIGDTRRPAADGLVDAASRDG